MSNELDQATLLLRLKAFEENERNYTKASAVLGIGRSTLQDSIKRAAETGVSASPLQPAPAGFLIKKLTRNQTKDGILSEWVHLFPESFDYNATVTAIENALADRTPALPVIPLSIQHANGDLLTVYLIVDHHLGLYAWEPETGANYDLTIASRIFRESIGNLVAATPNSKRALILNVGDFFHSDDNTNRTRRSGNILDADGRYAKILEIGVDLELYAIELVAAKHECVEVRNLPGNHDPYASIALNTGIRMAFRDNPRVHISRDPSPFFFMKHGKVLISSTHGDMIRATDMPAVLAAFAPKEWGATEHRYIYLGHVHHSSIGGGERYGATWETFRTLAAKDAWASQSGYAAGRSMVAITHHSEHGEVMRNTVTIAGPGFKRGL